jgi:beta-lactamase superfamily II metal-dependent hydrolase
MGRILISVFLAGGLFAQQNGKLQLHFMDVGQGDGAVLISPQGQVVLFDAGEDLKLKSCDKPLAYLRQLGINKIDYLIISHYHFDHIGCVPEVLAQFPLTGAAYDRGASYPGDTYEKYAQSVQGHRQTAEAGQTIRLDAGTRGEVDLSVIAVNGAGIATTNENDLSVSILLAFGSFRAEIGGDLSGAKTGTYKDIETTVAPLVGRLDVYKVHHHCSSYSSNETWLETTRPAVGIISTGDGNGYGHPAPDCVARLHAANVAAYWTETGAGATPQPGLDTVGGSVVVEVAPGAATYTVRTGAGSPVTYPIAGAGGGGAVTPAPVIVVPPPILTGGPKYAWSKRSTVYHYADCAMVARISADNLVQSDTPPDGKRLHENCPQKPAEQ